MTLNIRSLSRLTFNGFCVTAVILMVGLLNSSAQQDNSLSESQIQRGLSIAPVYLNLQGKNPAQVALGSYLVNAVAGCGGCHTSPSYLDGGNPFLGQPEAINTPRYLAGGTAFGPFVSRNLTPDALGRPAGLTFAEFQNILRTGIDDDKLLPNVPSASNDLLQVMPWPEFKNMTDNDMRAIYEFLSAIPCVETPAGPPPFFVPPAHSCT